MLIRVTPHSSAPTRDFADGPADFKVIFDTKHLISGVHLFLIGLNSHSFQAPSQFELWAEPVRSRAHPWRICIEMVSELATIQWFSKWPQNYAEALPHHGRAWDFDLLELQQSHAARCAAGSLGVGGWGLGVWGRKTNGCSSKLQICQNWMVFNSKKWPS